MTGRVTRREREVLTLVCDGHSNLQIAGMLGIKIDTVDVHRSKLRNKLAVHNTAQMVVEAIRRGMYKI